MVRGIRHARNTRSAGRRASQRSISHGTTTTGDDSQRTRVATPPHVEPRKKRGRKPGSQTKLRLPQQGAKVTLKPRGDMQFSYVNYKPPYKYTTQLGAIIRREYPTTLIEDKDEHGHVIGRRAAVEWDDYFLNTESVMTSGERVLSEFWRLFEVAAEDQEEADRVLETYLKKRETMYGPEKATPLNVYAVMKSGIKTVDSTGRHGAIRSHKAQKRMDDYIEGSRRSARPEEEDEEHEDEEHEDMEEPGLEEDHLNEQVLYDVSAGSRNHGRLAIGHGAVRAADVRAAAKERSVRRSNQSNPVSMQSVAREMARLRTAYTRLQQENREKDNALQHYKVATELTLDLYRALGKEIPENALQRLSAAQAIATGSSHVGSESTNDSIDVDGHGGEGLGGAHIDDSNHHSGNNACV